MSESAKVIAENFTLARARLLTRTRPCDGGITLGEKNNTCSGCSKIRIISLKITQKLYRKT